MKKKGGETGSDKAWHCRFHPGGKSNCKSKKGTAKPAPAAEKKKESESDEDEEKPSAAHETSSAVDELEVFLAGPADGPYPSAKELARIKWTDKDTFDKVRGALWETSGNVSRAREAAGHLVKAIKAAKLANKKRLLTKAAALNDELKRNIQLLKVAKHKLCLNALAELKELVAKPQPKAKKFASGGNKLAEEAIEKLEQTRSEMNEAMKEARNVIEAWDRLKPEDYDGWKRRADLASSDIGTIEDSINFLEKEIRLMLSAKGKASEKKLAAALKADFKALEKLVAKSRDPKPKKDQLVILPYSTKPLKDRIVEEQALVSFALDNLDKRIEESQALLEEYHEMEEQGETDFEDLESPKSSASTLESAVEGVLISKARLKMMEELLKSKKK
jgi:hypothetical protein